MSNITDRNQPVLLFFFPLKKNDDKIMSLFTDNLWRMKIVKPITLIIQCKVFILLFHKTSSPPTLSCSACIFLKSWLQMVQMIPLIFFPAISAYCTFWLFIVQHFLCFSSLCKGKMLINVKNRRAELERPRNSVTHHSAKSVARCIWQRSFL